MIKIKARLPNVNGTKHAWLLGSAIYNINTHTHTKRKKCTKIQYNDENWFLSITLVSNLPLFWADFVSFALGVQVFKTLTHILYYIVLFKNIFPQQKCETLMACHAVLLHVESVFVTDEWCWGWWRDGFPWFWCCYLA